LIERALKTIDLDLYDEILQKIALRKWNELKSEKNIFTKKGKVFRFLASRGFESELIYGILNDLEKK
jgi:regulatory protein